MNVIHSRSHLCLEVVLPERIQYLQIRSWRLKCDDIRVHIVYGRYYICKFTVAHMCVYLRLRFHSAVCQTECRYCKIKVFCIPVRFSERKFLSKCRLIYLYHPDSMRLQIQHLISDRKRYLWYRVLYGDILSWKRPIEYRHRTRQHSLHDLVCERLRIYRPVHRDRLFTVYVTPYHWWFYTPCSVWLYPRFLSEQETSKCLTEVLYHVISLILTMYKHIQSDVLLPLYTFLYFTLHKVHILLLSYHSLSELCSLRLYILGLWEWTYSGGRKFWKSQLLLLESLSLTSLRKSYIIRLSHCRKPLSHLIAVTVSCSRK